MIGLILALTCSQVISIVYLSSLRVRVRDIEEFLLGNHE